MINTDRLKLAFLFDEEREPDPATYIIRSGRKVRFLLPRVV